MCVWVPRLSLSPPPSLRNVPASFYYIVTDPALSVSAFMSVSLFSSPLSLSPVFSTRHLLSHLIMLTESSLCLVPEPSTRSFPASKGPRRLGAFGSLSVRPCQRSICFDTGASSRCCCSVRPSRLLPDTFCHPIRTLSFTRCQNKLWVCSVSPTASSRRDSDWQCYPKQYWHCSWVVIRLQTEVQGVKIIIKKNRCQIKSPTEGQSRDVHQALLNVCFPFSLCGDSSVVTLDGLFVRDICVPCPSPCPRTVSVPPRMCPLLVKEGCVWAVAESSLSYLCTICGVVTRTLACLSLRRLRVVTAASLHCLLFSLSLAPCLFPTSSHLTRHSIPAQCET